MAKSERRSWDRNELLLAMNLYCRLPFGKQHSRNPQIVKLAQALGRTPGSVAMKLNNFTSLDPDERLRGVRGLSGRSKLDQQVWNEFNQNWDGLIVESAFLWERLVEEVEPSAAPEPSVRDLDTAGLPTENEVVRQVRVRLTQRFFRDSVLASFNEKCCITGNPIPALLEAAHILPWSASPETRVNPRNGLCLSRVHHTAFDLGLITLDEAYRVVISRDLRNYLPNEALEVGFVAYECRAIRLPEKFLPEPAYLEEHRRSVFKG